MTSADNAHALRSMLPHQDVPRRGRRKDVLQEADERSHRRIASPALWPHGMQMEPVVGKVMQPMHEFAPSNEWRREIHRRNSDTGAARQRRSDRVADVDNQIRHRRELDELASHVESPRSLLPRRLISEVHAIVLQEIVGMPRPSVPKISRRRERANPMRCETARDQPRVAGSADWNGRAHALLHQVDVAIAQAQFNVQFRMLSENAGNGARG